MRIANDQISIDMVPALGGKIASIIWQGQELLLQPRPRYDWSLPRVDFENAELSGWDEMFPTIVTAGMPDHGEVWSSRWSPSSEKHGEYGVECATVPAHFARAVQITGQSRVRFDYRVKNRSSAPLEFLWAAHPQFVVDADDRILVDGPPLQPVTEPPGCATTAGHESVRELAASGRAGKWWSHPDDRVASVSVERAWVRLTLSLESDSPAQWGLWVDRGAVAPRDVVSVQPAFGWHDDLDRARETRTTAVVPGGETVAWALVLELERSSR